MASTCSICCDIFDIPKLLNCAHTFCESCLQEYINKSSKIGHIECPLCRTKTSNPRNGAKGYFENFFATQRPRNQQISQCGECFTIQLLKLCSHCRQHLCVNCVASHNEAQQIMNTIHDSPENLFHTQAAYPHPLFNTSYHVVRKSSFSVYHEESTRRYRGQICITGIIPLDEECIVCPNGENVIITFNTARGVELERRYLEAEVVTMTLGINGLPLFIGNHTSVVFEIRINGVHPIANTGRYIPFTLAALNNGRFVVLSVTCMRDLISFSSISNPVQYGVLQIYGMSGELYVEVTTVNGEHKLAQPRDVTVNLMTNEIYVADHTNMSLQLYKEDGTYVTSYDSTDDTLSNNEDMMIFPFSCCFDVSNQLLLASDTRGKIRVFSPSLELQGVLSSHENFGFPSVLFCNTKGQIFMGDHHDGTVKVFMLSEYSNKLVDR